MSAVGHSEMARQEAEDRAPYRFERRCSDRWPQEGQATAFQLGGDHFGQLHEMRMQDYGPGGLAAISDTAIAPGASVTLGFSVPGYMAARGTVLRCVPCGEGYRVAIRFELPMAA